MESGRFRAGQAWVVPRFLTEFKAIWFVLTGLEQELRDALALCQRGRGNGIRAAAMLDWGQPNSRNPSYPLVQFSPRDASYAQARERVAALTFEAGLYLELAFSCDQQRIVPDLTERMQWLDDYIAFVLRWPHIVPQLGNEPFKNGWSGADDPEFLRFGRHLASRLDGRAFSLGDPEDIVTSGAEPLLSKWATIAQAGGQRSYLVLHQERKPQDAVRYAGWVDHLRGADEVMALLSPRLNWGVRPAFIADEKMGGSHVFEDGRRDNRVAAHVAAELISAMLGGSTYLFRSEESAATPGWIESALAADIPGSPDFKFYNAETGGSPVVHFDGFGKDGPPEGKVRTLSNGREGYAVAYGKPGTLTWDAGYRPELRGEWRDKAAVVQFWYATR